MKARRKESEEWAMPDKKIAVEGQCPYCGSKKIHCGARYCNGSVCAYQCKNKRCLRHFNGLYAIILQFIGLELDDGTEIEAE